MIDDPVLWLWMVAAFVALVWRLLLLGGEVVDLERLLARRRNGLTKIESVEHVRTQAQWAFVAVVLLVVGLLAMLEVVGRGELSRWLLVSVAVVMAVAPILEWWDRRRKIQLTIDEDLAEEDSRTAGVRTSPEPEP